MSDSDEEKVLLDDESMDEMYELEDALRVSIDTNASLSPTKQNGSHRYPSDSEGDEDVSSNNSSKMSDISSRSSSSDEGGDGFSDHVDDHGTNGNIVATHPRFVHTHTPTEGNMDGDDAEDSDEPPEIPGSPIAERMTRVVTDHKGNGDIHINTLLQQQPQRIPPTTSDILIIPDEDYEVREYEQPRAAEFHDSSSSESEKEYSDDDVDLRSKSKHFQTQDYRKIERPKTAVKDLEQYRDAVPNEFFQEMEAIELAKSRSPEQVGIVNRKTTDVAQSKSSTISHSKSSSKSKYAVYVPQEVENLFQLIDAYTPEEIEIGTRLEAFIPDCVPAIGLPFDGIQIPRPDGKEDGIGTLVLREPSGNSNLAELELLMRVNSDSQHKSRFKTEIVRSIENAAHRPKEIDQWIASVAKVENAKPLAQVIYKKPMPSLEVLMELWPEEMEQAFSAQMISSVPIASMDVNLHELIKLVCVILDIPVYEGNYIQSLHALFSLFHEIKAYEHKMTQHPQ